MTSRTTWLTCIAVSVALMLLALRVAIPASRERAVSYAIDRVGGDIEFEYCGPDWAHSMVRDYAPSSWRAGFIYHVRSVGLGHVESTTSATHVKEIFSRLQHLESLREFQVSGLLVGDNEVARLSSNYRIDFLALDDTAVTDAGIERIRDLRQLKDLHLVGTRITDRAIDVIAELPKLEVLSLDRTGITDAGLDKLTRLKTLRELSISQTDTTDAAIDRLHEAIPGVQITDD